MQKARRWFLVSLCPAFTYRNRFHGKMPPIPDIQLLQRIYCGAVKNNLDLNPEELTWGGWSGAQDLSEKEIKEQSQEQLRPAEMISESWGHLPSIPVTWGDIPYPSGTWNSSFPDVNPGSQRRRCSADTKQGGWAVKRSGCIPKSPLLSLAVVSPALDGLSRKKNLDKSRFRCPVWDEEEHP